MILEAKAVHKTYPRGSEELHILRGIDFQVGAGEAVCIVGSSGAGKSTFLHILGALDRPSQGEVYFNSQALGQKSDSQLAQFRNESIGFVFQFHHLLSEFSALENVMMPQRIAGHSKKLAALKATELLDRLGLKDRIQHFPSEMSGGEQQRVAIARALVMGPKILLADEPTGNLDTNNSLKIQELLFELKQSLGLTLVVVTHDMGFSYRFPRVMKMRDGQWEAQRPNF